jgi:integrase
VERDFAELILEAVAYKRSAFAVASQRTYKSQLKCYLQFCLDYSRSPVPADQETLSSYLAFLARKLSANSIPNYMNVVRLLHLQAGFKNPLEDNFEIGLIKKGIKREKGVPPVQKAPITVSILRRIHATLDLGKPSDLAFWAVCVLGFLGFMRKSTLLPATLTVKQGKMLLREDIVDLGVESFSLRVRHSKVIQFGERVHMIPFAFCSDPVLCPIRAIMSHLGASPMDKDRPLFNYKYAGREIGFTQSVFVTRLRGALGAVGINPNVYSAHSLRRGGASLAFDLGLSPIQIKLRGDWASNAFERYVFVSSGATGRAAVTLSTGICSL